MMSDTQNREYAAVYNVIPTLRDDATTLPSDPSDERDQQHQKKSHSINSTAFVGLQSPLRSMMAHKLFRIFSERSLIVDVLAILFGIGTWLGVNGTFIQLPVLVSVAPEGWSLPSYLSIMVQIGNLGPLVYTCIQKYSKHKIIDAYAIYILLTIGSVSLLLTSFFYDRTVDWFGVQRSVPFFILTIFTAINACTSSVLFMPYMGRFKEKYLVTFFIGEGFSGLLPSVVALAQGIGSKECRLTNVTALGEPIYEPYDVPPRFGTEVFFLILFALMVSSLVGFVLLNNLNVSKKEYAQVTVSEGNNYVYEKHDGSDEVSAADSSEVQKLTHRQYWALLILTAVMSFFSNGMFGSIKSFSALPYGDRAYHLSETLTSISNPVACFLAMFLQFTSLRLISILACIVLLLTTYVFTTAALSPFPPLYDQAAGGVLVVIVWTLLSGFVVYTKLGITAVMRAQGGTSLVWVGGLTQIGSALGSVLIFCFINYTSFFQAAYSTC